MMQEGQFNTNDASCFRVMFRLIWNVVCAGTLLWRWTDIAPDTFLLRYCSIASWIRSPWLMLLSREILTFLMKGFRVSSRTWTRLRVLKFLCKVKSAFIHLVVCLTTGPKPLPKRALHIGRSRASSFKWEYLLLSLRSSSSFLRLLLPRLPVTSIAPFTFPSITRCRRQFLRKMWPDQFVFRLLISCRIFLCSLSLSNSFSFLTWWKSA